MSASSIPCKPLLKLSIIIFSRYSSSSVILLKELQGARWSRTRVRLTKTCAIECKLEVGHIRK